MAEIAETVLERKLRHVDACLTMPVTYTTRTTGFERLDLPYRALPETDLERIDTGTEFLGKALQAPVLIGAMTGGAALSGQINQNLAIAADRLGVGLMLGSQRVMLADPDTVSTFSVREHAPDVLLIGNLGVAQLNKGYGADEVRRAIELIGADALALHTNPLQEAVQHDGDGDFTDLVTKITALTSAVPYPLLLKEVGHGIGADIATSVAGAGLAALDVAGAGGTSWARVEEYVNHGEIRDVDLVEWGIPTATALREVSAAVPGLPLIASGGVRSGMDAAKALALGASVVAVAGPLLRPAIESADAVTAWLTAFIRGLRVAMHCAGAPDLASLASIGVRDRV